MFTVIGNLNADVVVGGPAELPAPGTEALVDSIGVRVGGSAALLALRAAQLGLETRLVARLGADAVGRLLRAEIDRPRLTASIAESAERPSPLTVAVESPGRDRAFWSTVEAMADLTEADVDPAWLAVSDVALSGSFLLPGLASGGGRRLLERARAGGARTHLDPGWPPPGWTTQGRATVLDLLTATDVFYPNDDEIVGLTGHADPSAGAAALAAETATTIVLKRGARGAELHRAGRPVVRVASPAAVVVDSTGAGDSLNAAFVAGLSAGREPADALAAAVGFASRLVATPVGERDELGLSPRPETAAGPR